ncbi:Glucose-specific phosphotransferase enzyme IIA component [Actinomyces bovis]|uniref:Glucose-specific phosphotransferase enzyme IIA component n=1 Tax=Actinomyces bovis TaxID=1658 RepID=A0ABY1VKT2_9ACTO|nr:PTS glucose transporter subunit IIA [Actinomyces bovis]SPT52709.1 Glucose-specific phosphotransferase enzyme IIA component [Actinomyces bovis]VEG54662.1 Glucose-specific phosphotransferase enzyme IIA component [Actinomyces israelii]
MTLTVTAPLAGKLVAIEEVPDPVFSGKFVGPGIAVDPERDGELTAVAPISGRVVKVHPHAFVIVSDDSKGVLVHLGLDTVQLAGEGFKVLAKEGDQVKAGDPMVTWNPAQIEAGGRNPIVPIIALETEEADLTLPELGSAVTPGDRVLTIK